MIADRSSSLVSCVVAEGVENLPDEAAISVATLAELNFGVHAVRSASARKARIRRLTEVESRFDALPIDESGGRAYGALPHTLVSKKRSPRARVMDLLIAATAQVHEVPPYTRKADDFAPFRNAIEVRVV